LELKTAARNAALELVDKARLKQGQTVIIGCSTSEIMGQRIGSQSNMDIGKTIYDELFDVFSKHGVNMAVQCCEHLNRAIIVEQEFVKCHKVVNVVPTPEAGGAFAAVVYKSFKNPVAIEEIEADAGIDIGGTMIGMHLKRVAVPVRLNIRYIGEAVVLAARTRPPLIGGNRASYNESIM